MRYLHNLEIPEMIGKLERLRRKLKGRDRWHVNELIKTAKSEWRRRADNLPIVNH